MKQKHIHKYGRSSRRKDVYRCLFSNCAHYTLTYLLIGKLSICNLCGSEYELSYYDLRRSRPRCDKCKKGKLGRTAQLKEEFVESLLERIK